MVWLGVVGCGGGVSRVSSSVYVRQRARWLDELSEHGPPAPCTPTGVAELHSVSSTSVKRVECETNIPAFFGFLCDWITHYCEEEQRFEDDFKVSVQYSTHDEAATTPRSVRARLRLAASCFTSLGPHSARHVTKRAYSGGSDQMGAESSASASAS